MKKTILALLALSAFATSGAAAPLAAAQRPVVIRMATAAPRNSEWERTLQRMGAEWRDATAGAVHLRVFASRAEDEAILAMRTAALTGKGLNAAAISNDGLAGIERGAFALNMPVVFDSYEEWDFVRERVNPLLEERLAKEGFIVLAWSDIGWVHFFAREPLRHPDQLGDRLLAASATDTDEHDLLKSLGFNPVPTSQHDVVVGLQAGRIDTLYTPIILAEATQLFRHAEYMTALPWAPLQGAIVVHKSTWESIAPDHHEAMLGIARQVGEELRRNNRDHERRSLELMVERGLRVVQIDGAAVSAWRQLTEDNYDRIRGELVDAAIFDRVMELRDEYRRSTDDSATAR